MAPTAKTLPEGLPKAFTNQFSDEIQPVKQHDLQHAMTFRCNANNHSDLSHRIFIKVRGTDHVWEVSFNMIIVLCDTLGTLDNKPLPRPRCIRPVYFVNQFHILYPLQTCRQGIHHGYYQPFLLWRRPFAPHVHSKTLVTSNITSSSDSVNM